MQKISLPYGLYMAEAKGYLNTRESKLQKIIRIVKSYPNRIISESIFYSICKKCEINPNSLTEVEIRRIQNAIQS